MERPDAKVYCWSCGTGNVAGDRYCGRCGAALSARPGAKPARKPAEARRPWALPTFTLPAIALPKLRVPQLRAPQLRIPALSLPTAGAQRIPRTTWIVGLVLVLLLIVPLAYVLFPSKGGAAATHRTSSTSHPSASTSVSAPAGSPQAVAAAGVEAKTGLKYGSKCSTAQACLSITGQTMGQAAAAVDFATAPSGGRECVGYVVQNNNAWQLANAVCGLPGQVAPMVGRNASIHVPGNCARVRTTPSLQGGVAGCLYDGTAVKVDGGPVYADSLIWWHTNRGWMAQDYLG